MKSCSSLSKRQLPRRVEKTVSTTISNFESSVPSTSSVSASLPQNNIPNSPTFNNDLVEFDSETSDTLDIEFDRLNNDTNAESSCLSDSSTDFEDEVDELRENLRKWSLDNNVTGSATSSLLKLLRNHSCFSKLPADVLSLLLTRRDFVKRNVPPGRYRCRDDARDRCVRFRGISKRKSDSEASSTGSSEKQSPMLSKRAPSAKAKAKAPINLTPPPVIYKNSFMEPRFELAPGSGTIIQVNQDGFQGQSSRSILTFSATTFSVITFRIYQSMDLNCRSSNDQASSTILDKSSGVTPFERHVINALAEIKQRLDIQAKNTKQIYDYMCKASENINVDEVEFGFPHDTMEVFDELENSLQDKKRKKQLINHLKTIGGNDYKENVANIMTDNDISPCE
ncbi:hypothetical protein Fcan01_08718 [Folsomia candida]|uniref:Uncharacterized protein n=1 Tax=Folsomia candida TaxID=158441 RepID=A0A226EFS8_FOLCA|nr:hypothetical protein Fcan01_08718 [Folsomia candida]